MKIYKIISQIKDYHYGMDKNDKKIDDSTTRDQVLYGNVNQVCTGIATCCWASIEVIQKAITLGINLIICHEALFWNHGDSISWLEESSNYVFQEKKRLLEDYGIVVWRNHDYVHSGIPIDSYTYQDGIFYGIGQLLGWTNKVDVKHELRRPVVYSISAIRLEDLVEKLIKEFGVNGARFIGQPDMIVKKVYFCSHISGSGERELIQFIEKENIDLLIAFEIVDFTVCEYIKDCEILGKSKALLSLGHFNTEEIAMKYMTLYLENIVEKKVPIFYLPAGDMYHYKTK